MMKGKQKKSKTDGKNKKKNNAATTEPVTAKALDSSSAANEKTAQCSNDMDNPTNSKKFSLKKHKQLSRDKGTNGGSSTLSRQDSSGGDEYGFLDKTRLRRAPRVSITAQTPVVPETDYLEENMLNRSYRSLTESITSNDIIPITLGSISSTGSYRNSPWGGMPMNIPPSPGLLTDENYVTLNTPTPRSNETDKYKEQEQNREPQYEELSTVRDRSRLRQHDTGSLDDTLNFYPRKAAEHRARSRSRTDNRNRSSSAGAELKSYLPQTDSRPVTDTRQRSPSRGRSQSRTRDIVELYTNRSKSRGRARERSPSTHRSISTASPATLRANSPFRSLSVASRISRSRDRNLNEENKMYGRSKSESRRSSVSRDAISMCSNMTTASKALSTSEIAQENLQLWMTTTSKNQSPSKKSPKKDESFNFVTLLEMDTAKNNQIEKELTNANSVKPASIKMMMIAGHTPDQKWESKDEVTVKAGAIVTGIYKQNEWLFIMTDEREVGFVPFAYTKPIKVTAVPSDKPKKAAQPKRQISKPPPKAPEPNTKITGILKTSKQNKQKAHRRQSQPKYSVKVRTTDSDSVSSENSSVFVDDFVYTRHHIPAQNSSPHADCMVEADDNLYQPGREDMGTYCSDSGISEPNSNHSDDLELHSPTGPTRQFPPGAQYMPAIRSAASNTHRLANERVVSVTTHLLANSAANSSQRFSKERAQKIYDTTTHINNMPLGPLGARLSRQSSEQSQKQNTKNQSNNSKKIGADMRERARCASSKIPASMRPQIPKDYTGPRVTVVYDYEPENEDDLQVHASDIVTLLNGEDTEWIWVQRRDGQEGFIPKEYVIPLTLGRVGSVMHSRRTGVVAL